ncbi:hypothetical protein [Desulfolutivibrio sp.]|uniref:hypothetical protein n=1 Tax=Desulfolutivibrio sp. TaxID=2773296 RepID=UPI002F96437C
MAIAQEAASQRFRIAPVGRPDQTAPVIRPGVFRPGPLVQDVERLSRPGVVLSDEDIINVLVKYFHAYIYPGSEAHAVPLGDISELFWRFCGMWWEGTRDTPADLGLRGTTGYALRMLADLPKTGHIFRSIAGRPAMPSDLADGYVGLDLGTGTGVLLLAASLQARRRGAGRFDLLGVEYDTLVAERTGLLLDRLGVGRVVAADARDAQAYIDMVDGPITFVANETIPGMNQRMQSEHFSAIHGALFEAAAARLRETLFFPEGLVAVEPKTDASVVLSRQNRFQVPKYYRNVNVFPRAIIIEGRLTALTRLGKDFPRLIPPQVRRFLPRRW